jgi:hypothetical protein
MFLVHPGTVIDGKAIIIYTICFSVGDSLVQQFCSLLPGPQASTHCHDTSLFPPPQRRVNNQSTIWVASLNFTSHGSVSKH